LHKNYFEDSQIRNKLQIKTLNEIPLNHTKTPRSRPNLHLIR
jgi:hypothetical protein